jgi:hypothetical protein
VEPSNVTADLWRCPLLAVAGVLCALAAVPTLAQNKTSDSPEIQAARAIFAKYVALEHAFDPAVADLYSDDALIRNKRTYPTGQVREVTLPAPQYKALMRTAMPLAKVRGDTSEYSDCTYMAEVRGVRIKCKRFSNLKKYTSPISLLVAPASTGRWHILEELSESQP